MFSVRIVTTDHYLAEPVRGLDVCYSEFRGTEVKRVPVFRLYGSTPAAQKTCMHVHGVFPYLYVPYDGTQPLERFTRQFAGSVDKALNVALGRAASTIQHVYKITLVSGRPMYGYHEEEQQFLKVYLYNPQMVRKVADLLLGGAVMNKVFQPHESHIPYKLQLFMDYNLYGMNMINVAAVKFRKTALEGEADVPRGSQGLQQSWGSPGSPATPCSLPLLQESLCRTPSTRRWDLENIPSDLLLDGSVARQSTCELEVDVVAADILNRLKVGANVGTNPGLAALWEDEKQRRREHGQSDDLTPQQSQDRGDIGWTPAEAELQERLRDIITDLQQYIEESPVPGSPGTPDSMPALESSQEATPASLIEHHLSQQEEDIASTSSQGTVILEDEEPVINETSILRVVSSSQSFHAERPPSLQGSQGSANSQGSQLSQILDTQDKSLAEMLASLAAGDDSPSASQAASQITALEDSDSILGAATLAAAAGAATYLSNEDQETMEMSQRVNDDSDEEMPRHENLDDLDFDLAGMDRSWNSSQWEDVNREEEQTVPQYDGPADEKPVSEDKTRRHLGTGGAIIQHNTGGSTTARNEAFSLTVQTRAGKTGKKGANLNFRSLDKPEPLNARITVSHVNSKSQLPKSATSNGSHSVMLDLREAVPMQPHNSTHYRKRYDKGLTNSVHELENKTYGRRKEKVNYLQLSGARVRASEKVTDNKKEKSTD